MSREILQASIRIGQAIDVLEDAIESDNVYWETLAIGQNTEQAESSGYLVGFRDALSAVHTLTAFNDVTTLNEYLSAVRDQAQENRDEAKAWYDADCPPV